ncbi:hypothetical protein A3Q56_00463 [Intoshia linei]|uniref:C2H2-type domain-containing protein n=1 Tax=Intoshia linei TaxID=1819745 RepID=A0A177BDW4_9BILA|nr:hypothetical protein A3Q56_00463 [Intoshia linei]
MNSIAPDNLQLKGEIMATQSPSLLQSSSCSPESHPDKTNTMSPTYQNIAHSQDLKDIYISKTVFKNYDDEQFYKTSPPIYNSGTRIHKFSESSTINAHANSDDKSLKSEDHDEKIKNENNCNHRRKQSKPNRIANQMLPDTLSNSEKDLDSKKRQSEDGNSNGDIKKIKNSSPSNCNESNDTDKNWLTQEILSILENSPNENILSALKLGDDVNNGKKENVQNYVQQMLYYQTLKSMENNIINSYTYTDGSNNTKKIKSLANDEDKVAKNCDNFCNLCNKTFCNKYYLRKHKSDVHGLNNDDKEEKEENKHFHSSPSESSKDSEASQSDTPNIISCKLCGKKFINVIFYSMHMRSHQDKNVVHDLSKIPENAQFRSDKESFSDVNVKKCENYSEILPNQNGDSIDGDANILHKEYTKCNAPLIQYLSGKASERVKCRICNKELCNKYFLKTHMSKIHNMSRFTIISPNRRTKGKCLSMSGMPFIKSEEDETTESEGINMVSTLKTSSMNGAPSQNILNSNNRHLIQNTIETNGSVNMEIDGNSTIVCIVCLATFDNHDALKEHFTNFHVKNNTPISNLEKNYNGENNHRDPSVIRVECPVCKKEVCNKYFLKTHLSKKHNIQESSDLVSSALCNSYSNSDTTKRSTSSLLNLGKSDCKVETDVKNINVNIVNAPNVQDAKNLESFPQSDCKNTTNIYEIANVVKSSIFNSLVKQKMENVVCFCGEIFESEESCKRHIMSCRLQTKFNLDNNPKPQISTINSNFKLDKKISSSHLDSKETNFIMQRVKLRFKKSKQLDSTNLQNLKSRQNIYEHVTYIPVDTKIDQPQLFQILVEPIIPYELIHPNRLNPRNVNTIEVDKTVNLLN